MAVTGSGTQTDPYIVHSYQELKSVCDSLPSKTNSANYVNLANDIDCNDYGDSFEWETLTVANWATAQRTYIDLDMCGHTIKNILVKANNQLFAHSQNSIGESVKIRNGKILNIFNNGTERLVYSSTRECPICFDNVSMSINTNGITDAVFYGIKMNKCAVYLDGTCVADIIRSQSQSTIISNSDFLLNCSIKSHYFINNGTNTTNPLLVNCRISGNIIFKGTYFSRYSPMSNCIVNVSLWIGAYNNYVSPFQSPSTGVVNKDKIHDQNGYGEGYWNTGGMTGVTDAELHSASALKAKGFNVIEME